MINSLTKSNLLILQNQVFILSIVILIVFFYKHFFVSFLTYNQIEEKILLIDKELK